MPRVKNKIKIANKIKAKSIESYLLCIEIYNKPTIQYRIEASSYFICNAWELLLKAHYISINGEKSIYRPNSKFTFSLEEMLEKYFQINNPIRKNLQFIINNIRNKSTHFIIPEHDYIYTPFLQKAVLNYSAFLYENFNINIADKIPFEYLSLISRKEIKPKTITKLYSKNYAEIFEDDYRNIIEIMSETKNESESIFAQIDYTISFTKDVKNADIKAYYTKNSPESIGFKEITVAKNSNSSHPYTMKQVIKKINQINLDSNLNYNLKKLNNSRLSDFNKSNNIANKPEYYFAQEYGQTINKKYSDAYVDFILEKIKLNPLLFSD